MSDAPRERPWRRWLRLTPDRLVVALLAVEGLLLLGDRFGWFAKGWAVLSAVASVGAGVLLMLVWLGVALVFRWRFQFSIRSLLLLTVVVAVPCSWLAAAKKQAKEEREVVAAIEEGGGDVSYDYEYDISGNHVPRALPAGPLWLRRVLGEDIFGNVTWVGLAHSKGSDAGLGQIKGFTQLQGLCLDDTTIGEIALEHLKGFTQLQVLLLVNSNVSDAGLEHLKGFTQLQVLSLRNTKVSDAELGNFLKGLNQLQELYLQGTKVSDDGLVHLKGLAKLHWLDLSDTGVSDAGLKRLKGLTQLRELYVEDTKVSDAGVRDLQKALPKCNIHRWRDSRPPSSLH